MSHENKDGILVPDTGEKLTEHQQRCNRLMAKLCAFCGHYPCVSNCRRLSMTKAELYFEDKQPYPDQP